MHDKQLALLADQARHGSLVVFVGAGASTSVGLPSWGELLKPLLEKLGVVRSGDPLDQAQWYEDAFGRPELLSHVRKTLDTGAEPSDLHRALASIQATVYVTTNYDRLMEVALERIQGIPPDVVIEDGQVALIEEGERTTVVKLHGCLSLPSTIVLTRDDYEGYADGHRAMIAYLQSLLATRTFLFVGVSLTDPNFRAIHQVIRRALGEYNRHAYLLDCKHWAPEVVRFWERRGIHVLEFANKRESLADGVKRETEFILKVADASQRDRSGLDAANSLGSTKPPPPIQVLPLINQIQALPAALACVFAEIRREGLLKQDRSLAADVPFDTSEAKSASDHWLGEKARSLLDLALAIDALVPIDGRREDPTPAADARETGGEDSRQPEGGLTSDLWIEIGDTLYDQHDSVGAILAYNRVLRPGRASRPNARTIRRVYGNLARAHIREGHIARAEWLLRRCVFIRDREQPTGEPKAAEVFARLNKEHLADRPTDSSELAYVISCRAEQLIAGENLDEAFDLLREARHMLGPVLGEASYVEFHLLFFDGAQASRDRDAGDRGSQLYEGHAGRFRGHRSDARAYAYNFLGKCYRLSAWIAPRRGHSENYHYYHKWADQYLHTATNYDRCLPYPYGHRFLLATDPYLPPKPRAEQLARLFADLAALASDSACGSVVRSVEAHLPAPTPGEPPETTEFRARLKSLAK